MERPNGLDLRSAWSDLAGKGLGSESTVASSATVPDQSDTADPHVRSTGWKIRNHQTRCTTFDCRLIGLRSCQRVGSERKMASAAVRIVSPTAPTRRARFKDEAIRCRTKKELQAYQSTDSIVTIGEDRVNRDDDKVNEELDY